MLKIEEVFNDESINNHYSIGVSTSILYLFNNHQGHQYPKVQEFSDPTKHSSSWRSSFTHRYRFEKDLVVVELLEVQITCLQHQVIE
jgi:hypothetical protein